MPANSNALTQNAQGRWDLTLKHDKPNVNLQIPARLTYDGIQVTTTITNVERTINTDWYTELGVPINPDDIDKYAQPVTKDGKTYVVTGWTFTVEPYEDSGTTGETVYSVEIEPRTASIAADGHISLKAYYIGRQGGSEVSRITVTSLATWSGNNSYVIVNGGSVSGNNTSTSTTRSSVVSASYSGKTGYCNITVDKASGSGVTYQLVVEPASTTIAYNGTANLTATFYTIRQGVPDEGVDVTRNPNCTWTSSNNSYATVSNGGVSGHNDASVTQDVTATITAVYNQKSGSSQVTVTKKGGETGETTYELSVSATPSSISWSGSSWLTAEYVTLVDGQPTSRVPVSPGSISWEITKNPGYGTINATTGEFVANNQSLSGTNREIKIKGTYSGLTSNEVAIQVSKRPAEETTYKLEVVPSGEHIGSADTIDLQAWFYTYEAGSLEPTDSLNVTEFANCVWSSDKLDVATVSAGHVVSDNQTYAEQVVFITASYCGYTDDASVVVAPKEGQAPEYYYALVVVPTAVTLEYSGSAQLKAEFRTYEGTNPDPVTTEVVTTGCQWSTDNQLVGVDNNLNKGMIQSHVYDSAGTTAQITAVYQRSYSSFTGTSEITVNGKFIDFDIDTTPITVECSSQFTVTREITTTDDITWHAAAVDVEHIGAEIDWLSLSPENGSGSGSLNITITEENSGSTTRDCFVWVHYPADSNVKKEITVTQYPTPRFNVTSQSVTAPQLGSTERVFVSTNFSITGDTNGNDWITLDSSRAEGGFNLEITTTEASAERSGVIYVESLYSGECASFGRVPITVTQEYTPPVPPEPTGDVYLYESETAETPSRPLEFTRSAAEADIEIWISSSMDTKVVGITGDGITIRETNGLDLTTGATISATGLDHRRKLIVHIPKYFDATNDRTFTVAFKTFRQSVIDGKLVVLQRANHYYDDDVVIKFFNIENQDLGQEEVTINSGEHYIKPYVYIESNRRYDNGDVEVHRMVDYIDNGGIVDDKIGLNMSGAIPTISTDIRHGGAYNASLDNPYELYFSPNQGYTPTGTVKDTVLELVYKGTTPWITKRITVHQEYSQKQLDPVDMHILSGSSHVSVDVLSANTTQNGQIIGEEGTGSVYVQGEAGVTLAIGGEYGKFTVGGDMQYGVPYPLGDANGKSIYLTNTVAAGNHYSITITCSKADRVDKTLLIDVTVH